MTAPALDADPIADQRKADDGVGADITIAADAHAWADRRAGRQDCATPDLRPGADACSWSNRHMFLQLSRRVDRRFVVAPPRDVQTSRSFGVGRLG